jgi:hypothetical protein
MTRSSDGPRRHRESFPDRSSEVVAFQRLPTVSVTATYIPLAYKKCRTKRSLCATIV